MLTKKQRPNNLKLDVSQKFWKKYIKSDYLERDGQLNVLVKNFESLIKVLNSKKLKKEKSYKKIKIELIKNFLNNYFDDLIETMQILKR